jgi:tRNA threonylcarbamoyladenosine biosynthesis protein TsaE
MAQDVIHAPIVETVLWPDELATERFAARLALQPALRNAFIALHGDLGAGKTTLVRHLLRALGVSGRIKSPTYAVVEPYTLPDLAAWHFDFYRFNDPQEWEDAGFRDIFASPGLKLAEWPDKAAACLPTPDLTVQLLVTEEGIRQVTFNAHSEIGRQLLVAVGCAA